MDEPPTRSSAVSSRRLLPARLRRTRGTKERGGVYC